MKNLLLAIFIFCGSMAVQSQPVKASGATVVFLQVKFNDYLLTSAIRDKYFNSSKLYNYLETSANNLYVARINPLIFGSVTYYSARGFGVTIDFDQYQKVEFNYIASLKAMIGVTEDYDIIVLLPLLPENDGYVPKSMRSTLDNDGDED